jgi:hypothetical protein
VHPSLKQDNAAPLIRECKGNGTPKDTSADHDYLGLMVLLSPFPNAVGLGYGRCRHDAVGCR